MNCAICKKKTTYDVSYGMNNFIVCPDCFKKIKKFGNFTSIETIEFILAVGRIQSEGEKNGLERRNERSYESY